MRYIVVFIAALVLFAELRETRHRNEIWRSDKALWEDAILKSPSDGRAWMNAGLTYMAKGEYSRALAYFYMCDSVWPGYAVNKINLGIAHEALRHDDTANAYFREALKLSPGLADAHHFYGRWLMERGFCGLGKRENEEAIRLSGGNPAATYLNLRQKFNGCPR